MESKRREVFRSIHRLRHFIHTVKINGLLQFTEAIVLIGIEKSSRSGFDFDVKHIQLYLNVTQSAISQAIKALEEKAFIQRSIHPQDRRKFVLTLTDDGQKMAKQIKEKMDTIFDEIFDEFTDEEVKQFSEFTEKILASKDRVIKRHSERED